MKSLALRVLALAAGQVVPADVLVDALWGDAPPARPEDQPAVTTQRSSGAARTACVSHHASSSS